MGIKLAEKLKATGSKYPGIPWAYDPRYKNSAEFLIDGSRSEARSRSVASEVCVASAPCRSAGRDRRSVPLVRKRGGTDANSCMVFFRSGACDLDAAARALAECRLTVTRNGDQS